ncbi:MAG: hypothetical protein BWK80_13375 [Desulfobacteraceae bacterium IS3]|nr:MAG: hypothetical protein BWK80_13375 [Desulfobacteraceae bacterium IS3]
MYFLNIAASNKNFYHIIFRVSITGFIKQKRADFIHCQNLCIFTKTFSCVITSRFETCPNFLISEETEETT